MNPVVELPNKLGITHVKKIRVYPVLGKQERSKYLYKVTFPISWTKSLSLGQRNDILEGEAIVRDGGIEALIEQRPDLFIRYHRGFVAYAMELLALKERPPSTLTLLIGNPGCGKTWYVRDLEGRRKCYYPHAGSKWFDGYRGQPAVLLDDFAGASSNWRLDFCLQFLDVYEMQLPVKGTHTYHLAERVYITSNIHPWCWYKWSGRTIQYQALVRRFKRVIIFEDADPYPIPVELSAERMKDFFGDLLVGPRPGTPWGDWKVDVTSHNNNQ